MRVTVTSLVVSKSDYADLFFLQVTVSMHSSSSVLGKWKKKIDGVTGKWPLNVMCACVIHGLKIPGLTSLIA